MVTLIRNFLLLTGLMVAGVVLLQDNLDEFTAAFQNRQAEKAASPEREAPRQPTGNYASADGTQLVIEAGPWGHFHLDTEISGREIGFLVDTGASMVALSQEDADTIGYPVHQLDYSGRTNTANGVARVAPVMIDEITVGDHVINNVQAVVIEGYEGKSLLGMTFLRKLAGFEVKNNRLFLRFRRW